MIKLMYIDTFKYELGRPRALFILADLELLSESKVAIFGTGLEAYLAFNYLVDSGIKVECFVNNDEKMWGRKLQGLDIVSPFKVIGEPYYIVIAMSQIKYCNEVLWQLKAYHHNDYGIAFADAFHSYKDFNLELHCTVLDAINELLCNGKCIEEIISPVCNCGSLGPVLGLIPEYCWTTTWSHCLMEWLFESIIKKNKRNLSMLEIGAGRGLFSLTVHKIDPSIDIKWLYYNMEEKSEKPVFGKYNNYPDKLFKTYYGMIEDPSYEIHDKFDIIVMTEVLEHFLVSPVKTMNKIKNMLEKDGRLFFSTPNWGHLPIYQSYKDLPEWTGIKDYTDMQIGHIYQYNKRELEELLDECGLVIEKYRISDGDSHNIVAKLKEGSKTDASSET